MTTPTPQDKQRFFALYLGCEVLRPDGRTRLKLTGINSDLLMFNESGIGTFGDMSKNRLILRSISNMTDEEKIELLKCHIIFSKNVIIQSSSISNNILEICYFYGSNFSEYYNLNFLSQKQTDYLRSIKILLPYLNYSIQDILGFGWAEYEKK